MADNLQQASKKSIYQARVAELDALGSNPTEFVEQGSLTAIENALGDFIERVHNNINATPEFVNTGKINELSIQSAEGEVRILGPKHLIFQDRGVNGSIVKLYDTPHSYSDKRPPVKAFIQYVKDKNIRLENNEVYHGKPSPFKDLSEEEQIERTAWAISGKIFREGFKPRNIFEKEIPKLIEDLKTLIPGFIVQNIAQVFDVKPSAQRTITP